MFGLLIFFQRKRKWLIRYGAVAAVGLAALLMVLPRADAHDTERLAVVQPGSLVSLLSPKPVSSRAFAVLYPVTHS